MSLRSIVAAMIGLVVVVGACAVDNGQATTEQQPGANGANATNAEPSRTDPAASESQNASAPAGLEPNAVVVFVVDGDTVEFDIDGVQESVRFIGIDTPEKIGGFRDAECYGDEASARMRELLAPGDEVYLELDVEARDRFDRLLAYVYRADDALFLNQLMVTEGWAAALAFEPNTLYSDIFDRAESDARRAGLGLWGACGGPDVLLEPSS